MNLLRSLISLFFPQNCRMCADLTDGEELCPKCKEAFIREAFVRCHICEKSVAGCTCGAEYLDHVKEEIGGKKCISLTFYDKSDVDRITEKLIYMLKDRGEFAEFFSSELAREVKSVFSHAGEDIEEWRVTYIPRSVAKFSEKGFDQGEEVAKRLAKKLGIKCEKVFFRGVSGTVQKNLDKSERRTNAEESIFPLKKHIRSGGRYIVFDDIVTTGATMETAIKHLYFCGAAKVFPVSIARNIPRNN